MQEILKIDNLTVKVENKVILKKINLSIKEGEIHAILGPNGNGKSTLLQTIMGNDDYQISEGKIIYKEKNINKWDVIKRAKSSIFLTFQNPIEIEGVANLDFLRTFINLNNIKKVKKTSMIEFYKNITSACKGLKIPDNYMERQLNVGFSGGEKKINELIQLRIRKPDLALIDEIDSGLDIDSLSNVQNIINDLHKNTKMSAIIISHYDKLYSKLKITKYHVLINGQIIVSGDKKIFNRIHKEGFDWIYDKYNLERNNQYEVFLEKCAIPTKK